MLEQDLRAAEHVACGNIGRGHIAGQADALTIAHRLGLVGDGTRIVFGPRPITQLHDRERLGRGHGPPVPAARVVRMAMRNQRKVDRARWVDPRVSGHHVDAVRVGLDPGKRGGHARVNRPAITKVPA